MPQIFL